MADFTIIEHTADTGIKVENAGNLAEVFVTAARAMTSLVVEGEIRKSKPVKMNLKAGGLEELMHSWLSEINYYLEVKQMIFCEFDIQKIDDKQLQAVCHGENTDSSRHNFFTEIKAITYHQMYVKKMGNVWSAQVIFDL